MAQPRGELPEANADTVTDHLDRAPETFTRQSNSRISLTSAFSIPIDPGNWIASRVGEVVYQGDCNAILQGIIAILCRADRGHPIHRGPQDTAEERSYLE